MIIMIILYLEKLIQVVKDHVWKNAYFSKLKAGFVY